MKTWSFLNNPFLNATDRSYRAMRKICNFTVNALTPKKADPFFDGLLTPLAPLVTDYNTIYANWISHFGTQISHTTSLVDLLKILSSEKIGDWDIAIQNVYKDKTPAYIALLPYHRVPFQNGSQEDKITAVEALITAIGSDAKLVDVKTDVEAFFVLLVAAYNTQKSSKANTGNNSNAVEAARIAVGIELYGVMGQLMTHFKNNPTEVGDYFDLQTIRNHDQTTFRHDIDGGAILVALTHTFETGDEVRLINRGITTLEFALVKELADPMPAAVVTIAPKSENTVDASLLGDIATNSYLKVHNADANIIGAYTIELL